MNECHLNFDFQNGFKANSDLIRNENEDPAVSIIYFAFRFRKLAEHFDRKAFSYRKLCQGLLRKSPEGKVLIDEEVKQLIDKAARRIYNDPHKSRQLKHMELAGYFE